MSEDKIKGIYPKVEDVTAIIKRGIQKILYKGKIFRPHDQQIEKKEYIFW